MVDETVSLTRLLLIDMTPLGGVSATGALKEVYFGDWPIEDLLQLHEATPGSPTLVHPLNSNSKTVSGESILEACVGFGPDIVLFRPVADRPALHRRAMELIAALDAPHIIWMMDDWPDRLRQEAPDQCDQIEKDLKILMQSAATNFAISETMATVFHDRYGAPFKVARNGVRPSQWMSSQMRASKSDKTVLRYAGSLAPDTTLESVLKTASVVSDLCKTRSDLQFEIRTQPHWFDLYEGAFRDFNGVTIEAANDTLTQYRQWLMDADILLVAYNFDEKTQRYLKYSFANKVPETLASGAAVVLFGPDTIETVHFLKDVDGIAVVTENESSVLTSVLEDLLDNPTLRQDMGHRTRQFAFDHFDLDKAKTSFRTELQDASRGEASVWRLPERSIDECLFIHTALKAKEMPGVMIDVGAHHGSSLRPFADVGWRVLAFEPDPVNRHALINGFGEKGNVLIFDQAIGEKQCQEVAFFTSKISSGISGLHAFHESHKQTAQVDVTTLNAALGDQYIHKVDFLKIDVEGHEMAALDGFDLGAFSPRGIVAEFDDSKTIPFGYTVHDLAERFVGAGYQVLVSEWRPITAYGADHEWCRLVRYPCVIPSQAWGNLIAFKESIDDLEIAKALTNSVHKTVATHKMSLLDRILHTMAKHHPVKMEFLRFVKWMPSALIGEQKMVVIGVAAVAMLAILGNLVASFSSSLWVLFSCAILGIALIHLLIAYGLERIERFEFERKDALNRMQNDLKSLQANEERS